MTPQEAQGEGFAHNAYPNVQGGTGLSPSQVVFSIVPTGTGPGLRREYNYFVARPRLDDPFGLRTGAIMGGDPDRWWVFDEDIDETEGWIAQAVFTPDGFINYGGDDGEGGGGDGGGLDGGDDEDDFGMLQGVREEEPSAPRNPHAPVTMSIDLDEADQAKREGLPAWEEHERFGVLVNEKGFAVVFDDPTGPAVGIVRYPDKTACSIKEPTPSKAREMAEKFLANRPYRTAMERVLGEAEFDAEEPAPPPLVDEPATSPAVPRPTPPKRQWGTVSINSVDDEDD